MEEDQRQWQDQEEEFFMDNEGNNQKDEK